MNYHRMLLQTCWLEGQHRNHTEQPACLERATLNFQAAPECAPNGHSNETDTYQTWGRVVVKCNVAALPQAQCCAMANTDISAYVHLSA